jgi:5-methylcytosine-specific restriction endonuclease McrA
MGKWKKPWGRELRWNRTQLLRRDGNMCQLCQEPMTNMDEVTVDHIQPTSQGGTDRLDNLRLVHEGCNQERGPGFFLEKRA